jgi:FAD/FMN-containing dehydrogenase
MRNFGGNQQWSPQVVATPASTDELLALLGQHRGRRIRVVGALHCWSPAVVADDVLVDLRLLNQVTVHQEGNRAWAEVGAGCRLAHLLSELLRQGNFTLPAIGAITAQSIAGAAATGTHGSGRHSLSHYPTAVTVAGYDPVSGEPTLRRIDAGDELRAARCSLGAMGIITSVRIPIRPQYQVEEHFRSYPRLDDVLAAEADYPLQQFHLVPWRWDYVAQHRREVDAPRSRSAPLYRLFWWVGMDVVFHLLVRLLARRLPHGCTPFFSRWVMPWTVPEGWKVVDRSDRQLTFRHELFRHIGIEIFVRRSTLPAAVDFIVALLQYADGRDDAIPHATQASLEAAGVWDTVVACRGRYQHHYPVSFRKVLPDDALISPASGDEPYYAVSFISYAQPSKRDGFDLFALAAARSMAVLFGARPHWGKACPLSPAELHRLYPRWADFRRIIDAADPQGRFRNDWIAELLK